LVCDLIDLDDETRAFATRAVAGLCVDSRKVKRGDMFFALAGARTDGLAFVAQAVTQNIATSVAGTPAGWL